jgi:TolB protein
VSPNNAHRQKNTLHSALLVGIILASVCLGEKIHLEAYATNPDSIPIGILPFAAQSDAAIKSNEPWKVIADDLDFSGRFVVVRGQKGDSLLFAQKNVAIYIAGRYTLRGSLVAVDCFLRDSKTHEELVGKQFNGEAKFLRSMMHGFSNNLVEMLFNTKGIFLSRILFVKDEGAVKNIMIMDYDGFDQRQLTSNRNINIFPVFVDSTAFIWTSFIRGHPDLFKGSLSTGRSVALVSSRFVQTSPSVSLIDGKVAFASTRDGNMEIYSCDADGSSVKRLTFSKAIDTSPCWSPNGYQIAFTSDRGGSPQIYVMDADGANTRRLTFEGNYQDSPAWSPKGDKIAYMSQNGGKFDIWTIQPDGSNPIQITTNSGSNEYPAWSPDGSHIAFSCHSGGRTDICSIRADGTHVKKITNLGNAKMLDWSNFY